MKHYVLLMAALLLAGCGAREEQAAKAVVAVRVARAGEADMALAVRAPATIFAREQSNVAARVTAPIRELAARKGDSVAAGQVLARLEARDVTALRSEAAAAVADADATLQKMVAGTLPGDIERARGQVATTQAALEQADKIYARRKQLYEQGAIPNRDLLVSQTELSQAKVNYDVAKKSLELLEKQSGEKDVQIARSRLEQARARLAGADAQLTYTEVRSPFAGTITEQFVFPGDMAKPDSPMFTVADLRVAVARAQVPEDQAAAIRGGASCSFTGADAADKGSGKVTMINRAVDPARRTVEVWCEIPNGEARLRAGAFGTVEVVTGKLERAIVVPAAAVQFEEGTLNGFVMVAGKDGKAHKRDVVAGAAEAGRVALLQGLKAGETVIVEGGYGLPDGTEVKLAEASEK